ncbi:hypothetical protein SAMN02799622_00906 [Methylobacterium sp. UNC378MF]|uniref:hypothetical protein n=1 Tax=Methylobacterium sp. UNC378MF TaxID=1502748 RepID=UPI00088138D9|nr:hypothetical protein [Methylobacterium sp. UNC378MF]SDA13091.1 hypothetical protein SAMN02799622_00906 [Methylobacterium sp. UNC378MF]
MTTLSPRRDALVAAFAAANEAAKALPPPKDRLEAINRELAHAVMESALTPIAEAMDLGVDGRTTSVMLASAIANVIASFCLSCADGDEGSAERIAIVLLDSLVDRVRDIFDKPATIDIVQEFRAPTQGRAQ